MEEKISENILKIRTIKEIIKEVKKMDENTALNENALRTLVRNGKIPSVKVGNKNLLTLKDVLAHFSNITK